MGLLDRVVTAGIDRTALAALRAREEAAFAARTPKSRAWLEAARATMPNGVPVAWMAGLHRHNAIVAAGGQYHGHIEESLVTDHGQDTVPSQLGLSARAARDSVIVPFNDLGAAEAVLKTGEIAVVMTEPALTNCLLVEPKPGFLAGLHA